jgi:hypothetical protein
VKALPEKPVPPSFASAARWIEAGVESVATSVAVIPRERARSHEMRSLESATIRESRAGFTSPLSLTLTPPSVFVADGTATVGRLLFDHRQKCG